jgi:hypothetical protein
VSHSKDAARLLCIAACGALTACASMGSSVQSFSGDYSDAIANFSDEELLTNVLRASDFRPLHFAELGQVNGSMQEQAQLGLTLPFGRYASAGKSSDSAAPQLTVSSSPTFTVSPLDTQAFTVGLYQSVDAGYFADLWKNANHDERELLASLFIAAIDNADQSGLPITAASSRVANDPANYHDFDDFIDKMLDGALPARFATVTVLSPIGPAFSLSANPDAKAYKISDIIGSVDETSVHLQDLNAETCTGDDCTYRLYRRWDNQLAICYREATPAPAAGAAETDFEKKLLKDLPNIDLSTLRNGTPLVMESFTSKGGGDNKTPGGSAATPKTAGGGGASGATSTKPIPIVSLVGELSERRCAGPVYTDTPQNMAAAASAKKIGDQVPMSIELRSVYEIFQYLGARVRSEDGKHTSKLTAHKQGGPVLFQVSEKTKSTAQDNPRPAPDHRLSVSYQGEDYVVGPSDALAAKDVDYSMKVMALLSQMVNALKLSSDIATTKQVQVIP